MTAYGRDTLFTTNSSYSIDVANTSLSFNEVASTGTLSLISNVSPIKFGINTNQPTEHLQVVGNASISQTLFADTAQVETVIANSLSVANIVVTGVRAEGNITATSVSANDATISNLLTLTGTPPLSVTSSALVSNLNVSLLNGQSSAYFSNVSNANAGVLAVLYGGTGSTTATGTGQTVLSTNASMSTPTLTGPVKFVGANGSQYIAGSNVNAAGQWLGYNRLGNGMSWYINQKGTGAGGHVFGECTASNVFTEYMRLDGTGNLSVGGDFNYTGALKSQGATVAVLSTTTAVAGSNVPALAVAGAVSSANGYQFTNQGAYQTGSAFLYDYDNNSRNNFDALGGFSPTTGVYQGTATATNGITGVWSQLYSPTPFSLGSYAMAFFDTTNVPKEWYVFGSNDGSTFTQLDTRSTTWSAPLQGTLTFTLGSPSLSYSYYRMVLSKSNNTFTISWSTLTWISGGTPATVNIPSSLGFLGVNNALPQYRVDVGGDLNVSGSLRTQGNLVNFLSVNTGSSATSVPSAAVIGAATTSSGFTFTSQGGYQSGAASLYDFDHSTGVNFDALGGFNTSTGVYQGTATATNGITGVWSQMQSPTAFSLSAYTMAFFDLNQVPKEWYVFGSNDGSTFVQLDTRSTPWTAGATVPVTFTLASPSAAYSYYRMVLNKSKNVNTISWSTMTWTSAAVAGNVYIPTALGSFGVNTSTPNAAYALDVRGSIASNSSILVPSTVVANEIHKTFTYGLAITQGAFVNVCNINIGTSYYQAFTIYLTVSHSSTVLDSSEAKSYAIPISRETANDTTYLAIPFTQSLGVGRDFDVYIKTTSTTGITTVQLARTTAAGSGGGGVGNNYVSDIRVVSSFAYTDATISVIADGTSGTGATYTLIHPGTLITQKTGNVGFGGQQLPTAMLHINDTNGTPLTMDEYSNTLPIAIRGRRARGTALVPTALQANDVICSLRALGHTGTAFSASTARIDMTANGAFNVSPAAYMQFYTHNGTTDVERIRIAATGEIGINTTTPSCAVDTYGRIASSTTGGVGGRATTTEINEYNNSASVRYWQLAVFTLGASSGNGQYAEIDGNFSRVDGFTQIYCKVNARNGTGTYDVYSETVTRNAASSGDAKVAVYYNSTANQLQLYIVANSFTYAQFRLRYETNWTTTNLTPNWTTTAPTTTATFTLVHDTSVDATIMKIPSAVGINTLPSYSLDVSGTARIANFVANGNQFIAQSNMTMYYGNNSAFIVRRYPTNDFVTSGALTSVLYGSSTGQVGVNTESPLFTLDVNGTERVVGQLSALGGSKIVVQNLQDGGTTRGIYLWEQNDAGWGIYMAQPGATKSLAGATAVAGSSFTGHAARFRVNASINNGFVFEDGAENLLASIRAVDGLAYFKGLVGFNTLTPASAVDVVGVIRTKTTSGNNRVIIDAPLASQAGVAFQQAGAEMAVLYRPGASSTQINMYVANAPNGGDVMSWTSGGFVGINDSSPSYALDVSGSGRITSAVGIGSGALAALPIALDLTTTLPYTSADTRWVTTLTARGGASSFSGMHVHSGDNNTQSLLIYAGGSFPNGAGIIQSKDTLSGRNYGQILLLNPDGGNVGVNTSTPTSGLDIGSTARVTGMFTAQGGSKIVVQDSQDGGTTRGIYMWNSGDSGWGIYMAQSGATKSLAGATAVAGAGFTAHAIRFRVNSNTTVGFVFEDAAENLLHSIRGNDGQAYFKGSVGINQLSPQYPLHISGTIANFCQMIETTSTGGACLILKSSTTQSVIKCDTTNPIQLIPPTGASLLHSGTFTAPSSDNTVSLGLSGNRWSLVYANIARFSSIAVNTTATTYTCDINGTCRIAAQLTLNGSDLVIQASGRGTGGRALVHETGNVLRINFANDFTGGVLIEGTTTIANLSIGTIQTVTTYLNGWNSYDAVNGTTLFNATGYYKDSTGRVYFRGVIAGGNVNPSITGTAFTLAAGFRPPKQFITGINATGNFGELRIDINGNVMIWSGVNQYISLDSVSFLVT